MRSFYLLFSFYIFFVSCKRDGVTEPPVIIDTTQQTPPINKSLIVGWWKNTKDVYTTPSQQTYFDMKLRYFGADSFYYHDITNIMQETATGKWWWVGKDSFYIHITEGWGTGLFKFKVTDLTKNLMKHEMDPVVAWNSLKHDSTAVNSKPITTIAGTGENGNGGDGGNALTAQLTIVYGMATDKNGNLFLSDGFRHLRKISKATGRIETFAGTGNFGHSGDGGLAINADMQPGSIAADALGNVYFTENEINCIRKIDPNGMITTIAGKPSVTGGFSGDGGAAVNAELNIPVGICLDGAHNIYFYDLVNKRIRKINASDGKINTVIGNGNFGTVVPGDPKLTPLNSTAFTVDQNGNIYFVSNSNQKIFKLDAGTNTISIIAGSGTEGYNGEGVLANNAHLGEIVFIVIDTEGNLFFSEKRAGSHSYIRKLAKNDGRIYTVAGNGLNRYTGDGKFATTYGIGGYLGITIDNENNIIINDEYRIRKLKTK